MGYQGRGNIMDHVDFHICDRCDGLLLLRDEVVGLHPVSGEKMFMHKKCALPEHFAISIEDRLDIQTTKYLNKRKDEK